MNVTEAKLSDITGYTKSQIKHRRQNNWEMGVHFWKDERNATIYDLEQIEQWQRQTQQGFITNAANVLSDGTKEKPEKTKNTGSGPDFR